MQGHYFQYTVFFFEYQVQETSQYAGARDFPGQARAHLQGHGVLANCDPLSSVYSFDHNSAATGTVFFFFATAPEFSDRLPPLAVASFFNGNLPRSISTQARQMISFLIVFAEDVLHIISDLCPPGRQLPPSTMNEEFFEHIQFCP